MKDKRDFSVGDQVRVHSMIKEGDRHRTQVFVGTVIAIRGRGENKTFTVRKIASAAVAVERIWPLTSPVITKIEIVKRKKARRAKLYYMRQLVGKAATTF